MKRDLSEMEHMIDDYLAFARGQGGEALENVDLSELIEAVAADARRAGFDVQARVEVGAVGAVDLVRVVHRALLRA